MNTISNYSFYTYGYMKKAETKKDEKDSASSQTKTELIKNATATDASNKSLEEQHLRISAYDQQHSYLNYITNFSHPLNVTLTKYRDTYPNIIGFTAKVQSSLSSLCEEYKTKICGMTSKLANCKTQQDLDKLVKEIKNEMAKLMKQYEAKFNVISAIAAALPALSDVRDKFVGSEIDMHDELEKILNGITTSSDNKSNSGGTATQKVGAKLDKEAINMKMQNMKSKNTEYKEKLKKAEETKNAVEIEKNQSLITGSQKLIDVYSTVLKGFEALG